jgi:hypothetical protein
MEPEMRRYSSRLELDVHLFLPLKHFIPKIFFSKLTGDPENNDKHIFFFWRFPNFRPRLFSNVEWVEVRQTIFACVPRPMPQ